MSIWRTVIATAAMAVVGAGASTAHGQGTVGQAAPPAFVAPTSSPLQPGPLPHELHPDRWPQPDYFTQALGLTRFQPAARFEELKLRSGVKPALLVLPVQSQAFGWTPAFAAIVGARLDRELAQRGWNANRQTDLFDADGPYARRFGSEQIAAFAAAHEGVPALALYLGRDASGHDLVTVTLRSRDAEKVAHRSIPEMQQPLDALDAMASTLPALLDQLGLTSKGTGRRAGSEQCKFSEWELRDDLPSTGDNAGRACHALIVGTLLPEFERPAQYYPRPKTADKLAWLAQAYVEADALTPDSALAVRTIAWSQLELTPSYDSVVKAIDVNDPVAKPLARLLWASRRSGTMPVQSRDDATAAYADEAAKDLPPFAKAVFNERANFLSQFRRVRLCSIELQLPSFRKPRGCDDADAPTRTRQASRSEAELLHGWRLFAAYKELKIEGRERGDPRARQAVLEGMPVAYAEHPFVRRLRFQTAELNASTGSFDALLDRARQEVDDFVRATAELQRFDSVLASQSLTGHLWERSETLSADSRIAADTNDERRLIAALAYDGFMMRGQAPQLMREGWRSTFLTPGPVVDTYVGVSHASAVVPPPGGPAVPALRPPGPASSPALEPPFAHRLFRPDDPGGNGLPIAQVEQRVAADSSDMDSRVELALARLKAGQGIAQARQIIDARPRDERRDYAISESHAWAQPARFLFFAGELDAAREYYERVTRIGTGSSSDLHAYSRLRQIAGDIPGAAAATRERLARYESDYPRRDLAGFDFMLGRPADAWQVLAPRLAVSSEIELWAAVEAGQRIERKSAREALNWIKQSGYGRSRVDGIEISTAYLARYVTDDRVPSADDLQLLSELGQQSRPTGKRIEAALRLKQLAFADHVDNPALESVRGLVAQSDWVLRSTLKPLYAWVAWHASGGKDPELGMLRVATLSGDLDSMLAKAALLGLENQPAQALSFLRAARIELSGLSEGRLYQAARSAPYTVALIDYLLYAKSKDARYRQEALTLARAYQRIFPFAAWPYALDAVLSDKGPARTAAGCRAVYLDRDSLFLKAGGWNRASAAACPKPLWNSHSWRD